MVSNKTAITPTDLADYIISSFRTFDQTLKDIKQKIFNSASKRIERENQTLNHFQQILEILDPKNLLKRGYSISYIDNKIVKTASDAEKGETLITLFADGKIISRVEDIETTNTI